MQLSVIICTHNPRNDYLRRTIDALKAQTLPQEQWELLLIDNASKEPLVGQWNLSWHPHARHIREDELGLTPARLRGIKEVAAEILVFVDDDNVLAADYLDACRQISAEWPRLGAWGGQQFPEFEGCPPAEKWKADFWASTLTRDVWSNNYDRQAAPVGAGVCVRKSVADRYAVLVKSHPLRLALGRKGSGLSSAEDIDMAFVACDLGLGTGRFMRLELDHLMPANRITDDYLIRITEGFGYSEIVLSALRGQVLAEKCRVDRLVDFYKGLRLPRIKKSLATAYESGRNRAIRELRVAQSKAS